MLPILIDFAKDLLPWIIFALFDFAGSRLNFPILRDFSPMELIGFVFVIILVGAFLAYRRARNETKRLRQSLDRREVIAAVLTNVAQMRDQGVALRHEGKRLRGKAAKEDWTKRIYEWRDLVSWELARLSSTEVALFHTLDWFDAPPFTAVRDRRIRHEMRMLFAETHIMLAASLRWQVHLAQPHAFIRPLLDVP